MGRILSRRMTLVIALLAGVAIGLVAARAVGRAEHARMIAAERRAQQNERLAELGTLTGGLAHELKNPLSTIQLNLQLLLEDIRPEDPMYGRFAHRISTVQREASRLKEILEDFLRYAGRMELHCEKVEINSLLEDLVDFISPQAQLQKVQMRLQKSPQPIHAEVDPRLIKQAVLNLMLNGLQAIGPDGGEMIVRPEGGNDEAVIEVTDTGRGMSGEVVGKIFQAYFSQRKGGTGLGLAMAKRIVDEHHGRISVFSEEGKGSKFEIHLPRVAAQDTPFAGGD